MREPALQIELRGAPNPRLLGPTDTGRGTAKPVGGPKPYLGENQFIAVLNDEVDFANPRPGIAFDDPATLLEQEIQRPDLAGITRLLPRGSHAGRQGTAAVSGTRRAR